MNDLPPIRDRIRQAREDRRMSQSRLARLAGLDHSYVSRIESGDRYPSVDALEAIVTALDLAPADRLEWFLSAGYVPPESEADLRAFLGLPAAARHALLAAASALIGATQ